MQFTRVTPYDTHTHRNMLLVLVLTSWFLAYGSTEGLQNFHNVSMDHFQSSAPRGNTLDTVAFSAELSDITELPGDITIVFDRPITISSYYIPNSGQFVCPDSEVYVFIWSIRMRSAEELEGMRCITKLRLGAVDLKPGPKTSYHDSGLSGVAEMTAVLQCTTSPPTAVTVMTVPWSQEIGDTALYYQQYTSFSGFRLQNQIAFTAQLSEDQYLIQGSKIRFDDVLSNFGGYLIWRIVLNVH